MKKTNIEFEQYNALLKEVEDEIFHHLIEVLKDRMPPAHAHLDTLFAVVMGLARSTICYICDNDQDARKRALTYFSENLSKMVTGTRVVSSSILEDKHQIH